MIYRTDPFGRFTFVNPVATRILGFGEGELLSMKYFELLRPDWVQRAMDFYEKAAKTRESTYLEFPVRKKDGEEIWVGQHVRPIITGEPHRRLPGHGARHHRSCHRPVGARCRTRLRLRDSRHRAEPHHGARRARSRRALQPRLRRAVRRDDVGGRRPALLGRLRSSSTRIAPTFATACRGWSASNEPIKLDRVWLGKNGTRHVIAWTIMALRGQHGQTSYLIGLGADVTMARERVVRGLRACGLRACGLRAAGLLAGACG